MSSSGNGLAFNSSPTYYYEDKILLFMYLTFYFKIVRRGPAVRITRSHRVGRGSTPRVGSTFFHAPSVVDITTGYPTSRHTKELV